MAANGEDRTVNLATAACRLAHRLGVLPARVVVYSDKDNVLVQLPLSLAFFMAAIEEKQPPADGPPAEK